MADWATVIVSIAISSITTAALTARSESQREHRDLRPTVVSEPLTAYTQLESALDVAWQSCLPDPHNPNAEDILPDPNAKAMAEVWWNNPKTFEPLSPERRRHDPDRPVEGGRRTSTTPDEPRLGRMIVQSRARYDDMRMATSNFLTDVRVPGVSPADIELNASSPLR